MSKLHDEVTARIIAELEKGAMPWIKPWSADSVADKNIISQESYKGINRLLLGIAGMGYSQPVWGTFKQWQSLGASVRKGEKGTGIVFYQPMTKGKDKVTGEDSQYMLLKQYYVFNVDQVEGIQVDSKPVDDTVKPFVTSEPIEQFLIQSGAVISHGGDEAFYSPSHDAIKLPEKQSFNSESEYYSTAFHELTHWTGAKHRLDRLKNGRFGSESYAFEELVAELGASFLCQDFRVQGELRHAGYIESWIKCLKEHNTAIFKASALAQKSNDYLHGIGQ